MRLFIRVTGKKGARARCVGKAGGGAQGCEVAHGLTDGYRVGDARPRRAGAANRASRTFTAQPSAVARSSRAPLAQHDAGGGPPDVVACHAHSMSRHQQHLILNRARPADRVTNRQEPVHCSQRQLRVDSRAPARARCAAGPPARRVACPLLSGLFHTRHALPPRFRCHAPFTRTLPTRSWSRFKSKSIRGIQHRCPSRLSLSLSRARALPAASPRSTLLDRRRRRRATRAGLRGKEPASTRYASHTKSSHAV